MAILDGDDGDALPDCPLAIDVCRQMIAEWEASKLVYVEASRRHDEADDAEEAAGERPPTRHGTRGSSGSRLTPFDRSTPSISWPHAF
jgi:hypothetical protein